MSANDPKETHRIDQSLASSAEFAAVLSAFYKTLREEMVRIHSDHNKADAVALQLTQSWVLSIAMNINRPPSA